MYSLFSVTLKFYSSLGQFRGVLFQFDAKVLSLAHFDIIVGMDWLARFSPMQVD
jgi:hypothetical protein